MCWLGRRWGGRAVFCAFVLGLLVGCSDREPIRIGFLGGLSGRVADLGVPGKNGVLLAVEECNAAGGIRGRKIELLVRDDRQDAATAQAMMAELLGQGVEAVIGAMTSSVAMAVAPLADAARVVLLSPTATTTALTGRDDYFVRVIADTTAYSSKNARFQYEKLGHRKIAALLDLGNRAYTESWYDGFRREFEGLGGTLALDTFESGGDLAFYDKVQRLFASQPDAFLVLANVVDAAQICQQIRKIDGKMPIAIAEWASTERFIELAGHAAEGVYVAQFLDREDSSPRYQRFRQDFVKRFGREPGFAGLAGYDSALVLIEAMKSQVGGQSLKDALLAQQNFEGAQQRFAFDRFGDSDRKTYLSVFHDGRYLVLE